MGRQFPKVQVTRKSGGLIGGPTTDYTAYTDLEQSDRGDVFGMRAAHLQVHHGDDVTQIQYPQHQAEEIYGYGGRRSKEHPMGSNVYRSHTHQDPHESGRLFNLEHTQGNDVVYSLFSTKEGRIHAPTLLGVAANDSRMRGRELQPPDDLSEHSSRMVQHFQRKGVVPASAPTAVTNEHEFVKSEYQRPEALYVWGATTSRRTSTRLGGTSCALCSVASRRPGTSTRSSSRTCRGWSRHSAHGRSGCPIGVPDRCGIDTLHGRDGYGVASDNITLFPDALTLTAGSGAGSNRQCQ